MTADTLRYGAAMVLASAFLAAMAATGAYAAGSLASFDFTRAESVREWEPAHDVGSLTATPKGMQISISGGDPYILGPARDYPEGQPLWLKIRLRATAGGAGQVFYFRTGPSEADSVRFNVAPGDWQDVRVPVPPLGKGYRLRLDPPGDSGTAVIASISLEPRTLLKQPVWPRPRTFPEGTSRTLVTSGNLALVASSTGPECQAIEVAGKQMAVLGGDQLIGYIHGGQVRWLDLSQATRASAGTLDGRQWTQTLAIADPDGGRWAIQRTFFQSSDHPGSIRVKSEVTVSQDRSIIFLPMLMLFPGAGNFGESKHQAVFPGLEYLENEPSSSEADIVGPASKRQVPDSLKITFPLMAIEAGGTYIGLIWGQKSDLCAVFDSPDRIFRSGGHVMGVLFPGADGTNREEGSLLPYDGRLVKAGGSIEMDALIIGGKGGAVTDAVRHYVGMKGLPALPENVPAFEKYAATAAAGWMDSNIRQGDLYRHAFWPGFGAGPAADAAVSMDWLAANVSDPDLSRRLKDVAHKAIAPVPSADVDFARVSHVPFPMPSLLYGGVLANVERAAREAKSLLGQIPTDGRVIYRAPEGKNDLARTHSSRDANGLSAAQVDRALRLASVAGDPELVSEAISRLRALAVYAGTVPRGAQTWEVPLHTPDILASAHLVSAYVRGYQLTGDETFLDQAREWAWTGVPFIYLVNPTGKPVGLYATIAVFGATQWQAPVWFGQPVQWCGLVYADALYLLADIDPDGPWKHLADGITASGAQQTWPASDSERVGLLPDFYLLRPQTSAGPAINPATLHANAIRFYDRPRPYDFRAARQSNALVHAPGRITRWEETDAGISFVLQGWAQRPCSILVCGLRQLPRVRINGIDTAIEKPHEFNNGRLVLSVQGSPRVEVLTGKE